MTDCSSFSRRENAESAEMKKRCITFAIDKRGYLCGKIKSSFILRRKVPMKKMLMTVGVLAAMAVGADTLTWSGGDGTWDATSLNWNNGTTAMLRC